MDDGVPAALAASHLARLSDPTRLRLLTRAHLVRVPAGCVLHREGETSEMLELVVTGLVRVFVTAPDGRSLTVRYARRGALIGVATLYAPDFQLPVGVQALVDGEVLRLSPDVVRRAAAADPRVADVLLRELADRTLSFIAEISDATFGTVRQKVARHLLDLASLEVTAGRGPPTVLTVRTTQRELADAVGSVREVVVRVLHDLREAGIIDTRRDHIEVLDPERLSREHSGT